MAKALRLAMLEDIRTAGHRSLRAIAVELTFAELERGAGEFSDSCPATFALSAAPKRNHWPQPALRKHD